VAGVALAAVQLSTASPATAQGAFPSIDVVQSCRATENPRMCERWERDAERAARRLWQRLPREDRSLCARRAGNSYMALAECVREHAD